MGNSCSTNPNQPECQIRKLKGISPSPQKSPNVMASPGEVVSSNICRQIK